MSSGAHLSRDFFELVKSIGESKSKQEEDRIIQREVVTLKKLYSTGKHKPRKRVEMLVRLLYVEMLGHDASFGYIHAVQMTAGANLVHKKTAYLVSGQTLHPGHEMRFMMVNQLQRDLQSPNHLQVCVGLIALTNIGTKDMIPALLPLVIAALSHKQPLVRKKAVMAMHHFWRMDPESVDDYTDQFRRILCDADPSVMASGLHILGALAKADPNSYKDLVPSFVSILKQITEHRLSRDYDYHRMPAPWIQIKLLQILATLGAADQTTSESMYEVVHEVMRRADTGINVGYAIMYECVRTVTTIYPNTTLLNAAADSIARFMQSENHNLKYLGVTGLASVVEDHPKYAAKHQMAVMDCLEDPDETLKRKTLQLLYRMTNPVNVEVIVGKLLDFLRNATDVFLRTQLVAQISQLAERFAPSNQWFITTLTTVFELGGDLVKPEVAHTVMRLIAEGSGEDDEADDELRQDVVEDYMELLKRRSSLPDILIQVMCWILGEYAYLMGADVIAEVCDQICEIAERITSTNSATRAYAITAVIKLTAQYGRATTSATALVLKYANSSNSDLQQRCYEFMELSKMPHMMREVLPVDASYEDLEVDPNLPFLDAFVQEARDRGMPEYSKPVDNNDGGFSMTGGSDDTGGLNFAAYATPTVGNSTVVNGGMISGTVDIDVTSNGGTGGGNDSNNGGSGGGDTNNDMFSNLKVTKNVWGSSGFTGKAAGMNPMNSNNTNDNTNSRSSLSGQYTINSTSSNNTMSSEPIEASIVPNSYNDTTSTTSGETKQTYTEPEPEPEPEISQREQEAMALFGGISSATTSTKKSGGRIRTRRNRQNRGERKEEPPVTEQPDAKVENNSGSNDLLDLMGGGGDTSTSSGGADDSVNMFADLGGDSSGGNGSANSSSSGGLLDMGDLMGGGSNNGGGMFDGLGGGMESTSVQQQPPGLVPGGLASTQEFGQLWVSLSNSAEVTSQVQSSNVRTPEAFMGCMSTRANLQGIQAISQTAEAICAGRDPNTNVVVLVHGQIISGGNVAIKVRSQDASLSQRCLQIAINALN